MRAYAFWLFLFCLLPFIVRRPMVGLTTYCILNVIRPELLFWGGDQGAKALIVVFGTTMLGIFVNASFDFRAIWKAHTILTLLVFFAIKASMSMASYLTDLAPMLAGEIFKVWILCIVVTMLLQRLDDFKMLLSGILYSSTFLAAWGIDQYFRGNTRLEGLGGDSMNDSNYIAAHFVMFMPLALQRAIHAPSKRERLIAIVCSLTILGVIMCTESRGGLLGLVAAIGLLVLTSEKKAKMIPYLVIAVMILAPWFITEQYKERIGTMTGEQELDGSAESRLVLWEVGWKMFLDNPVFGAGFGNYPYEKIVYENDFMHLDDDFRKWIFDNPKVTHSTVFQVLSEGGLVLAIPFFTLFVGTLMWNRRAIRRAKNKPHLVPWVHVLIALQCGLVGYYISMLFLNGLITVFSYVTVAICGAIRMQMEERQKVGSNESSALSENLAA